MWCDVRSFTRITKNYCAPPQWLVIFNRLGHVRTIQCSTSSDCRSFRIWHAMKSMYIYCLVMVTFNLWLVCSIKLHRARWPSYMCVHVHSIIIISLVIHRYAHTLASLKAYCHWLAQYYVESYHKPGIREQCAELITSIVNCVVPTVNHQVCHSPEMSNSEFTMWGVNWSFSEDFILGFRSMKGEVFHSLQM